MMQQLNNNAKKIVKLVRTRKEKAISINCNNLTSILTLGMLTALGCSNPKQREMVQFAREFSITNITVAHKNGVPTVETIILRTNGVYFTSQPDQIGIHIDDKYATTIF